MFDIRKDNYHQCYLARETILRKTSDISQLWEDLKELASARHEALSGAKQVLFVHIVEMFVVKDIHCTDLLLPGACV